MDQAKIDGGYFAISLVQSGPMTWPSSESYDLRLMDGGTSNLLQGWSLTWKHFNLRLPKSFFPASHCLPCLLPRDCMMPLVAPKPLNLENIFWNLSFPQGESISFFRDNWYFGSANVHIYMLQFIDITLKCSCKIIKHQENSLCWKIASSTPKWTNIQANVPNYLDATRDESKSIRYFNLVA